MIYVISDLNVAQKPLNSSDKDEIDMLEKTSLAKSDTIRQQRYDRKFFQLTNV